MIEESFGPHAITTLTTAPGCIEASCVCGGWAGSGPRDRVISMWRDHVSLDPEMASVVDGVIKAQRSAMNEAVAREAHQKHVDAARGHDVIQIQRAIMRCKVLGHTDPRRLRLVVGMAIYRTLHGIAGVVETGPERRAFGMTLTCDPEIDPHYGRIMMGAVLVEPLRPVTLRPRENA